MKFPPKRLIINRYNRLKFLKIYAFKQKLKTVTEKLRHIWLDNLWLSFSSLTGLVFFFCFVLFCFVLFCFVLFTTALFIPFCTKSLVHFRFELFTKFNEALGFYVWPFWYRGRWLFPLDALWNWSVDSVRRITNANKHQLALSNSGIIYTSKLLRFFLQHTFGWPVQSVISVDFWRVIWYSNYCRTDHKLRPWWLHSRRLPSRYLCV